MNKVWAIISKEWLEMRHDRSMLLSILLPPLLLTLLPIGVIYTVGQTPDDDITTLGAVLADPSLAGMPALDLGQVIIGRQFALLFLMMPLLIPSIIAAYSIVGEKTRRTLEPLLATPIQTWELLMGKCLTAFIPAIGITWLCGGLFIAGTSVVVTNAHVFALIIHPAWLLVLVLCTPMLALIAIALAVAISSRVNDPRTAQQLSGVVIIPILLLFFGQLIGLLVLNAAFAIGAAMFLAIAAVLAFWGAAQLFQREAILTRWS